MPGHGGGENGDLYLEVRFKPHPRYRIDGRDLTMTLPVAPWEAALGAGVNAPTPGGTVEVTVPAGSGHGRKLRLRVRGIPGDPRSDDHTSELQALMRSLYPVLCLKKK